MVPISDRRKPNTLVDDSANASQESAKRVENLSGGDKVALERYHQLQQVLCSCSFQ